jgi:hypothetical protein
MYQELGSLKRLRIAILVVFASGVLFVPSAIAQSDAYAAKVKFANDYNAGRFKDVIEDGEILRKFNELDPQSQLIIGQAYYKAGDFTGCVRYTKSLPSSETALQLQARCSELSH